MSVRAYLSLGSNIGDKRTLIAAALDHLASIPGITIVARSRNYRTSPWGDTDQDWFINACAAVNTTLSPHALLEACLGVEKLMGRTRTRKWGPRIIDIDILDYAGIMIRSDSLNLPHPHLFERAFVLIPLAEIAADLHIAGRAIGRAAEQIPAPDVFPLQDDTDWSMEPFQEK